MQGTPKIITRETSIREYTISIPNIRSMCLLFYLSCHPHSNIVQLQSTRLYKGEHGYYMALKALRKHGLINEWEVDSVRLWHLTPRGYGELRLIEAFKEWSENE